MARKILLADDSVTAQNMGRKILADAGYEVIAVNNGSAALKKIGELKPDLCILDVYMPGYSGLEVCQRMKESQESSRIPVLLSVGKLEPFKPEEAQRVRADGFIVKPFEASELLSALSKLEDKVVPRAEPSKPGRFARAIAAAEESARNNGKSSEEGWKSRIAIPKVPEETPEKGTDDASIYNPMNRDLRTVVQTPEQEVAETKPREDQSRDDRSQWEAGKSSVDVAALAPEGLPTDVTAEEVAAIASAAAQIQMAEAEASARRASEISGAEFQVTAPASEEVSSAQSAVAASAAAAEASAVQHEVEKVESAALQEKVEAVAQHDRDEQQDQPQSEPVTMAAATEAAEDHVEKDSGLARWTAVPVALEGEEASLSLEHEMQKMYAAGSGEAETSVPAVAEVADAAAAENTLTQGQSEPAPAQANEAEPAATVEAARAEPEPVAQLETTASLQADASSLPAEIKEEVASPPSGTESAATPEFLESEKVMPVSEFLSPVSEAEVAGLAGLVGLSADSQIAAQPENAAESMTAAAPPTSSKPFARIERTPENGTDAAEHAKPEQEEIKNAAAAWSSWRQIRDTGNGSEASEPAAVEPLESARAVAAGAEQIVQEAEAKDNPADVASIVDSVLADLRPKLMAEISRKMAEKK